MAEAELTTKQQAFVDFYDGSVKEAAQKANLSFGWARHLITFPHIIKAIQLRQNTEIRPKNIANRQKRQQFWTTVMNDFTEDMKNRLKASELLGKSDADFTENLHIKDDDKLTSAERENMRNILKERQKPPIELTLGRN